MQIAAYRKRADNGAWLFTEDPGPEPHEWEALYAQARDYTQKDLREAAAKAEGWIEWPGGPCPIDDGAILVDVRLRNGMESARPEPASVWAWGRAVAGSEDNPEYEVVAYRVLF